jgi:hypothetical protein
MRRKKGSEMTFVEPSAKEKEGPDYQGYDHQSDTQNKPALLFI